MGQYYHPTMMDEEGNITWIYTHDYGNGLKLMEHSYIGNSVMNAVFGQIKNHPLRIAWIGDYSDEEQGDPYEQKLPRDEFMHIYDAVYGNENDMRRIKPDPIAYDLTSKGWYLVNHTQQVYLSLDAYAARNKWKDCWKNWETGDIEEFDRCMNPLSLLTACGNDRGCGDYHAGYPDYNKVGTWAFDKIELSQTQPVKYLEVMYSFTEHRKEENAA